MLLRLNSRKEIRKNYTYVYANRKKKFTKFHNSIILGYQTNYFFYTKGTRYDWFFFFFFANNLKHY